MARRQRNSSLMNPVASSPHSGAKQTDTRVIGRERRLICDANRETLMSVNWWSTVVSALRSHFCRLHMFTVAATVERGLKRGTPAVQLFLFHFSIDNNLITHGWGDAYHELSKERWFGIILEGLRWKKNFRNMFLKTTCFYWLRNISKTWVTVLAKLNRFK